MHRNLACVIDKSSRGAKLERAFEELPYNFIKELNIPNEIKLLTWADGSRWHEIAYLNKFHEIMNDKDLVVILSKETKDWR